MEKINRNGKQVSTNCFEASRNTVCPGNSKAGYSLKVADTSRETPEEMLDRLTPL